MKGWAESVLLYLNVWASSHCRCCCCQRLSNHVCRGGASSTTLTAELTKFGAHLALIGCQIRSHFGLHHGCQIRSHVGLSHGCQIQSHVRLHHSRFERVIVMWYYVYRFSLSPVVWKKILFMSLCHNFRFRWNSRIDFQQDVGHSLNMPCSSVLQLWCFWYGVKSWCSVKVGIEGRL